MKKAVRILSLVGLIAAGVNLVLAVVGLLLGEASPAPLGVLRSLGLALAAAWLFISVRLPKSPAWGGPVTLAVLLALGGLAISLPGEPLTENAGTVVSLNFILSLFGGAVTAAGALIESCRALRDRRSHHPTLSLSTKVFWQQIVVGGLWITIAVLGFFRHLWIIDWLHLTLLLITVGLQLVMFSFPSDRYDEMALDNLKAAKARTLDILTVLFILVMGVTSVLQKRMPDLITQLTSIDLIFLILGLQGLISGLIFRKLEAN